MIIHYNNFITFSLNRHRNFLSSPRCEECGESAGVDLLTDEDVKGFCCNLLMNYDCPDSAVFVVYQDGRYAAFFKAFDDDGEPGIAHCEGTDMHMFAELDGEMRFCCYGLIVEQTNGLWMIQE